MAPLQRDARSVRKSLLAADCGIWFQSYPQKRLPPLPALQIVRTSKCAGRCLTTTPRTPSSALWKGGLFHEPKHHPPYWQSDRRSETCVVREWGDGNQDEAGVVEKKARHRRQRQRGLGRRRPAVHRRRMLGATRRELWSVAEEGIPRHRRRLAGHRLLARRRRQQRRHPLEDHAQGPQRGL